MQELMTHFFPIDLRKNARLSWNDLKKTGLQNLRKPVSSSSAIFSELFPIGSDDVLIPREAFFPEAIQSTGAI
ncbi:MAG: hypothetical protein PUC80_08620, partial [Stecheria intestinalis]|nr:hypothetical protein [Stecheria intestinalis]